MTAAPAMQRIDDVGSADPPERAYILPLAPDRMGIRSATPGGLAMG
jgi:hypothetical protein